MVQVGAFDSNAIASGEWSRLSGRHGSLFSGKSPVIQEHQSNGRTFFRLRVAGFGSIERGAAVLLGPAIGGNGLSGTGPVTQNATILGGIAGTVLAADEAAFFREADPWGFILFGRNVETPEQLRRLTGDLRECVGRDCVITVDQEGGRVQRLRAPHWSEWPAPLDQAEAGVRAMWLRYHLIGRELRASGIDSNCAPTLDVAQEGTHRFCATAAWAPTRRVWPSLAVRRPRGCWRRASCPWSSTCPATAAHRPTAITTCRLLRRRRTIWMPLTSRLSALWPTCRWA